MSDAVVGVFVFSGIITWMILGGIALGKGLRHEHIDPEVLPAAAFACLVFAPFAFGYVISFHSKKDGSDEQ